MRHLLLRLNLIQRLSLIGVALLIGAQVWFDLLIPDYMANIVLLTQRSGVQLSQLWYIGFLMLLAALGSVSASVLSALLVERIAAGFSRQLRADLFHKVGSFSAAEINKFSTASLITRATNDVSQVQRLISVSVWSLVRGPFMIVLALSKISGKGNEWLTLTYIAVFLMAAVFGVMLRLVIPKFKQMQELTDEVSRLTREHLQGLAVVHATNSQRRIEGKFADANLDLFKTTRFTGLTFSLMFPLIIGILNLFSVAIFWLGAQLIEGAETDAKLRYFADMVVFSNYAIQIFMSFFVMSVVLFVYPRASVAAKRINEVLNTSASIRDPQTNNSTGLAESSKSLKPKSLTQAETIMFSEVDLPADQQANQTALGKIEFRNVSFRFPDAADDTLTGINLTIEPGQTVGIIGATGSGKTSFINLIARFYDVSAGQVLVDGKDVRDYKLTELYEKLGYVTQQSVLFKGTVASNVAYGLREQGIPVEKAPVSEQEIPVEKAPALNSPADNTVEKPVQKVEASLNLQKALEIAQVADFVASQEAGLDMEIAQAGKNVSGGQKQRLAIARAIARDPEILIFDDSFSALDYRTDRLLREGLKEHTAGATTLIVAQRIGSIREADQIIVLDAGEIVGMGTHSELLQTCPIYQEIAHSQLSEAEIKGE
ncbi:ABC transporter ATP-binding protein/permease [Gleimia sp. 6138-11-ORH1]|uniref:ABC transporter ATP-binding protein n=1 Tax=Gleimia sp. 6138-11-ORH1 TaxID=2973937 RepID=UPI0021680631|nr:ABC transporter ATP-binding protein [Gleimia sp. 6138-11-ORH1]MCS4484847.1 ABC transporter ATP-binding protein/permease [Gleimia sp. 6138-11-ORH1]